MNRPLASLALLAVGPLLLVGCGSSQPEHHIRPPDPPSARPKTPTTKEEKIEAIKHAPISEAQKKSFIDQVNSGKL